MYRSSQKIFLRQVLFQDQRNISINNHLMFNLLLSFCLLLVGTISIKIFIIGGALQINETEIFLNMAQATGKKSYPNQCDPQWTTTICPKIAVITSAMETQQQGNHSYFVDQPDSPGYKTLFVFNGFSPKHLSVHRDNYRKTTDLNTVDGQRNFQMLREADIIFFNGGDQSLHARSWLNDDGSYNQMMKFIVERARREEVVLAGTSAGAMIMCSPIFGEGFTYGHLYFSTSIGLAVKKITDGEVNGTELYDDRKGLNSLQYRDNGGIMPGFNLIPFLIDSHVNTRGRLGRMVPAMIQTKNELGIGLSESTCLYFHNDVGTIYGKSGVYIVDLSKAIKTSKEYFSARNVLVTYLTSGDSFDFKTKKVTPHSSKSKIVVPAYSGHFDSEDIFGEYQIEKVYTRLCDQTSPYNVGRSIILDAYPSNAPVFRLTFEKTPETSAYWSTNQKKYTGVNVSVGYAYE